MCPATDSGPIRPTLKSVHFTKPFKVRSASRVTATQKTMFAAATVVTCRLKWAGWLCVMLCVCINPFGESFRD